jgi:hypothetical protein
VDKYRSEIKDSLRALWAVWIPAQLINFSFVPRHMRIPYVAAVSFGWTVILSVMQGKFDAARSSARAVPAAAAAVAVVAGPTAGPGAGPGMQQVGISPAAAALTQQLSKAAAASLPSTPIMAAAVAEGRPGEATAAASAVLEEA